MRKLIIFIVLIFCFLEIHSQTKIDSIWTIFQDETKADTIRLNAIHLYINNNTFTIPPDSLFILAGLQYELAASIDLKLYMVNALFIKGLSQRSKGDNTIVLNYYLQALKIVEDIDDKKQISAVLYAIGSFYQEIGMFTKALEYYKRAYKIDETMGNKSGMSDYYSAVGYIYLSLEDCSKSLEYFLKSLTICEELNDRLGISIRLSDIGFSYSCQNEHTRALEYHFRSLKMFEESGDLVNISVSLNNIGACYRENNEELLALDYFKRSLKINEKINLKSLTAELLSNIGKIDNNQGNHKKAIMECEKSLKIAEDIKIIEAQKNACECLYTAYKALGSIKALDYFEQLNVLNDSLKSQSTIKKMQNMEFAKQLTIDSLQQVAKDTKVEMAHQTESRQKDKNRNIAIGAGIFFLLLSGGLYSRWRYTKKSKSIIEKEKDRSDNLLLNILPAEIAQELKDKGKADARDFEMVSILFSDFKGFTGLSEKMSAKDLVGNINVCFEAFDNIMQKYNIEKIKTIGDAYMAAGGLPINSDDSVKRTVLAALEMQNFITKLHKEKEAKGEHAFEMRVGIHTGPVVAGIVGVKKFQYDIWGDTVNTASRMESNGAVGKVNISEDTYNAIENEPEFVFVSRGKVEAKGKGEIAMYFVSKKQN